MATDPASLLSQANCFTCYGNSPATLKLMQLSLWAQLSGGGPPTPPPSPPPPSPVWYDTFPAANIVGNQNQGSSTAQASTVQIMQPGTPIALRIAVGTIDVNGVGLKMAVYAFSGTTLRISASTTLNISDSNTIKVIPITFVGQLPPGVYTMAFAVNSDGGDSFGVSATGTGFLSFISYAAFPAATLTDDEPVGENFYMGIEIQP